MNYGQNYQQQNRGPPNAYQYATGAQNTGGMRQGPGGPNPNQFQTNSMYPPQNMMYGQDNGMDNDYDDSPERLEKLKIELTGKERGYYSNMLSKVQTGDETKIEGK